MKFTMFLVLLVLSFVGLVHLFGWVINLDSGQWWYHPLISLVGSILLINGIMIIDSGKAYSYFFNNDNDNL